MFTLRSLFSYFKQDQINILGKIKYPKYPPNHFINFNGFCIVFGYHPNQGNIIQEMKTYIKLQYGRVGREIIIMEKVIELLPKLTSPLVGFFYPILHRTGVHIHMMRQVIILI